VRSPRDAAEAGCRQRLGPGRSAPSAGAFRDACWGALAFAGLGLVVAQPGGSRLGRLDLAAISLIRSGRKSSAVSIARAVSALAEPGAVAVPLAAAAVIAMRRAGWRAACTPCVAVASGAAVRRVLSRAIARDRPPTAVWLTEPEGFSLPSKHTSLAALTAGACAMSVGSGRLARHAAPLLAAAGVGTSRVYLGVHWPSDVVAAWLFSEGWLHLAESVAPRPARRRADSAPSSHP
jgi:membrane-associated phospholipid phosphatase